MKGFTVWVHYRYYLRALSIQEFYGHKWYFVISVWQVVWWQCVRSIVVAEEIMNWQSGHKEKNARSHMRIKRSVPVRGEMYVWPLLRTGMNSSSEHLWLVVVLNSHTSTNGWGASICVRTIRKKCALQEWSAVTAPLHGKATFFFEQLRSIIRFIPECANTTSYYTSVKWTSLPNSCTLSWPGLRPELYIYAYIKVRVFFGSSLKCWTRAESLDLFYEETPQA